MASPLRLVIFDATDVGSALGRFGPGGGADGSSRRVVGLSPVWRAGTALYRMRGHADAWLAATSWPEALGWAASVAEQQGRAITSVQAWGHGSWGRVLIGNGSLDRAGLMPRQALAPALDRLRDALSPEALVWLRCCSTFGHREGRSFARGLAERLRCRVAAHTHIIGYWQSGAHSLRPGEEPAWDPDEGVRFEGGNAAGALGSSPFAPNTVSCLRAELPGGY
jgi:hypothetical protein